MTENNDTRRFYLPADRDKLSALDNITSRLDRIAAALEALAGIKPAADTPTDSDEPADASALTEHPAAGLSSDTTLKAVNERLDAVLDTLNLITGKTNPDAAFSMRTFADGSGRFLPVDSPAAEADTEPETPAAWTVTDASGRTICAGTDSNAADLVQKALEGYAPGEYTLHCPGDNTSF